MSLFQATSENPQHLSVVGVVQKPDGTVLCLKYHHPDDGKDYLHLVSETVEDNECLTDSLNRGLMEEAGVVGVYWQFKGSALSSFPLKDGTRVTKVNLIFFGKFQSQTEPSEETVEGEPVWIKPEEFYVVVNSYPEDWNQTEFLRVALS